MICVKKLKSNKKDRYKLSTLLNMELIYNSVLLILLVFITCGAMTSSEEISRIELVAHRGASCYYPENTMASIYGAIEIDADWIEIDIHQTRDQELVLSHDENLYRTSGVDINVTDAIYDEIKDIDIGSYFDPKFSNERIPKLENVIKFAKKNNAKLNIELKPTGKEINFEKQLVELIQKYDFEDSCMISSSSYAELETIKKLNKNLTTTYIVITPIGDISNLDYADILAVEYNSVSYELVSRIHSFNKKINIWVLNDELSIDEAINMNVDYITSDHIELAREILDSKSK